VNPTTGPVHPEWRATAPLLALLSALLLLPATGAAAPDGAAPEADVVLRDQKVLHIGAARAGVAAHERARAASRALTDAHEADPAASASFERTGEEAAIHVGRVPVLVLGPEDVQAGRATGIAELAADTVARIDTSLRAERRRARTAEVVFHVSLAVLSALVAWLLLRKLSELDHRIATSLRERRRRAPPVRVRGVELVSPEGVAGAATVAIRVGRVLLQIAIAWGWVVFALSLFPQTRGTGLRLGQVVLGPAVATVLRLGGAIPGTVALLAAVGVLWLAVHAIRLFFGSVARGETHLSWISGDLALPVGQLAAIALVVVAAVFAAPVLTGTEQGMLANVGQAALLAVALAAAPSLANVAAGLPRLLGRSYRPGHVAEIGNAVGVVKAVGLTDLELQDRTGRRVLVPHLLTLVRPTRLPGLAPAARLEVAVDPGEDQALVREILLRTGGPDSAAELVRLDGTAAVYDVAGPGADLAVRVASALRAEGVKLARRDGGTPGGA
jgi:small-conductance mechanosensitive channel